MIVYPYRKVRNISVPLIKINFANPDNPQLTLPRYSLLDTGADVTLVPYFLIKSLALPRIREENRKTLRGFDENRMSALAYFISFSFDSENFFDSIVYDIPEIDLREIIIGRNILNRFSITFDGINRRIIINS